MTFEALVDRDLRKVALDESRRRCGAAGVGGIDMKDIVLDRRLFERQDQCLYRIAYVGNGPQQIARARRSRAGPVAIGGL